LELRGTSPYDESWFSRRSNHDYRITSKIDVGKYLWARSGALRAHATQVDPTESFWFGLADDELAEVYPYEDWCLTASRVGPVPVGEDPDHPVPGDEVEFDLFAGIAPVVSALRALPAPQARETHS
ncbi:MAG TPA: hypothetical protein PLV68_16090, partial [Ilumatobacteraceae bacterium]|nr:hypothetical protein [Ilumatobacteraceae bacterium]